MLSCDLEAITVCPVLSEAFRGWDAAWDFADFPKYSFEWNYIKISCVLFFTQMCYFNLLNRANNNCSQRLNECTKHILY